MPSVKPSSLLTYKYCRADYLRPARSWAGFSLVSWGARRPSLETYKYVLSHIIKRVHSVQMFEDNDIISRLEWAKPCSTLLPSGYAHRWLIWQSCSTSAWLSLLTDVRCCHFRLALVLNVCNQGLISIVPLHERPLGRIAD